MSEIQEFRCVGFIILLLEALISISLVLVSHRQEEVAPRDWEGNDCMDGQPSRTLAGVVRVFLFKDICSIKHHHK